MRVAFIIAATWAALALASPAGADVSTCPGGANMELTAITVLAPPPPAPPAPRSKRSPRPPPRTPKPVRPPGPEPAIEPEPEPSPPPRRRSSTDAALDEMIGEFGRRPDPGPVVDPFVPGTESGIGDRLRRQAEVLTPREPRRRRQPERRPVPPPTSTPTSEPDGESVSPSILRRGTAPVRVLETGGPAHACGPNCPIHTIR
jgi:hypothetical protein